MNWSNTSLTIIYASSWHSKVHPCTVIPGQGDPARRWERWTIRAPIHHDAKALYGSMTTGLLITTSEVTSHTPRGVHALQTLDVPESCWGLAETAQTDKRAGGFLGGITVMRGILLNKGLPGISSE